MENVIIFVCILLIPCIAFSLISFTCGKYKDIDIKKKLSGFEVARKILDEHNLKDMYIVEVKGSLNDHYDYNQKVIRLSSDVFHGESIMSTAIAARIATYAIQDKNNNGFMKFKFTLNSLMTFANYIAYILFIVGLCFEENDLLLLASGLILLSLLFHIVTLPVEFDNKKIANKSLKDIDVLEKDEINNVSNVLNISVYSFIMSILTCVSNLFREIMYNLQRRG